MKITSFAIQKGGAGKTTTAVCVSSSLARKGRRALLTDMDPQANATECLMDPDHVGKHVGDLLLDRASLADVTYPTDLSNLRMIPAHPDMLLDEYRGYYGSIFPDTLRIKLAPLSQESDLDYIFIDCPPNLLHFTKNALLASQYVMSPMEPEPLPYKGLRQFIENILRDVQLRNPSLAHGGVILIHRAPGSRKYMPAAIRSRIDTEISAVVGRSLRLIQEIRLDQNLAKMAEYHKPICLIAPDSNGTHNYAALSVEIEARIPP